MDGLLINSEDMITRSIDTALAKYGRSAIPPSVRVKLMGIPDSTSSDLFHDWAKVPIERKQFDRELREEMKKQFVNCEPMPGAEKLLSALSHAQSSSGGAKIGLALASTTKTDTYHLKLSRPETRRLLENFADDRRILGDDSRVAEGRSKPAPDIYLVALDEIRKSNPEYKDLQPNECLVFEDSVIGVEAGRRAGMRVVWLPHPHVAAELKDVQHEVLAARTGTSRLGDEWQLGELGDGWAESISSLEEFDFEKYGIQA